MASHASIASVGKSLERIITLGFSETEPVAGKHTLAHLVRSEDFAKPEQRTPCLSILLYRVDVNRAMRAAWSAAGHYDGRAHLPLDIHFLVTPWADTAEHEYAILGRALQLLEDQPILSGPLLAADDWATHEAIQVVLDDSDIENVARIFESLHTHYKLSIPYVARVVRVDGDKSRSARPVTQVSIERSRRGSP